MTTQTTKGGRSIKVADYLLATLSEGGSIGTHTAIDQFDGAGGDVGATSAVTYGHLANRILNMSAGDVTAWLSKKVTPGEYYKNRAGVKHSITALFDSGQIARATEVATGYLNHQKPPSFNRRKTKRTSNNSIVEGWRDIFLRRLGKSTSIYKSHAILCYLTGMRPHEFTSELGATIYYNDTTIEIEILGAKVKLDEEGDLRVGMPKRRLTFELDPHDPAIQMLLAMRDTTTFKTQVKFMGDISNASAKNGLAGLMATCGRDLLGKHKSGAKKGRQKKFTVYNLRHMYASALKASDMSEIDISRALGHISQKTKGYYGRYNAPHSSGALMPAKVSSSHEPRPIIKQKPAITQVAQASPSPSVPAKKAGQKMRP